jgi:hypothetical protein
LSRKKNLKRVKGGKSHHGSPMCRRRQTTLHPRAQRSRHRTQPSRCCHQSNGHLSLPHIRRALLQDRPNRDRRRGRCVAGLQAAQRLFLRVDRESDVVTNMSLRQMTIEVTNCCFQCPLHLRDWLRGRQSCRFHRCGSEKANPQCWECSPHLAARITRAGSGHVKVLLLHSIHEGAFSAVQASAELLFSEGAKMTVNQIVIKGNGWCSDATNLSPLCGTIPLQKRS